MGQTSNNGIKSFLTNLIRSFDDDFSLFVEGHRYGYEEFKNIAQIPEEVLEMYRAKEESKNMRSHIDMEKMILTALQNESFEEGFFYSTERTIGKVSNNLVNSYLDCIEFLDNYISRFTFDKGLESGLFYSEQKDICYSIFYLLGRTGILDVFIPKENEIIKTMNEILSEPNQIELLTKDSIVEYIKSLNCINNDNDKNLILLINRHFLNKLGHSCEILSVFPIYHGCGCSKFKEERIDEVVSELLETFRSNDINDDIKYKKYESLYKEFTKKISDDKYLMIKELSISDPEKARMILSKDIKNGIKVKYAPKDDFTMAYREHNKAFSVLLFKKFEELFKEYSRKAKELGKTDIDFKGVIKSIIDGEIPNEEEGFSDILNKIQDEINSLYNKIFLKNPEMTYIQLAENITREDRFMQVKHKTTQALLMRYLAGDKSLYIEKEDINGENGATTIYLDGSPQIWSVHHKEYEEIASDPYLIELNNVDEEIAKGFNPNSGVTYNIFSPMKLLTEEQKSEFKKLAKTIRYLDGIDTEIDSTEEYLKLDELRKIKDSDDKKYTFYRNSILLGAGVEEFKKYYGKREHNRIIDEKNVEEEKKMLYNMCCRGTSYLDVEIVLGEFYKIENLQNVIIEEEAYDTK